jgi:long-chain-fatty-acid---luciferin-component ligase
MTFRVRARGPAPSVKPNAVAQVGAWRFENASAGPAADPLDALLGRDDLYALSPAQAEEVQMRFLRRAVAYHRDQNPAFDRLCALNGADPHGIDAPADLQRIPLLPAGVFKRHSAQVRARTPCGLVTETRSSGTRGTVSVVPRDDVTLMRFFASVAIGKREVVGAETFDRHVMHLGPLAREAPALWIAYVMAGVGVLYSTRSYVHNNRLEVERLVADLRALSPGARVSVVGPPPLLLDLVRVLEERGPVALSPDAVVLCIGGWKQREGETPPRAEFDARVAAALGLSDHTRVRDTYNMVELNSVLFECACKAKHAPPWLQASARDPRSLRVLPSGEPGLLAFLDPTPTSYPGFVLSDDFGVVHRRVRCPCGIEGDTVQVERRVNRAEMRGCALRLETVERPASHAGGEP